MGYSSITLRSGALGSGASFKTIAQKGMRLSEIVPVGIDNPTYWSSNKRTGFNNLITVQVLDKNGYVAKDKEGKDRSFKYTRPAAKNAWTSEGYWHRQGESAKITSDNDEIFDVGEGLWIQVDSAAYGQTGATADTFKLTFNGEALLDGGNITLRSGAALVIPPLSADVKLSKIIPLGIDNPTYWSSNKRTGFNNLITIQVLDKNGYVAKDADNKDRSFKYTRPASKNAWTSDGYWHRQGESTKITADYDETFKMGEGLWVQVDSAAYGQTGATADTFKLSFPGIDDTYVEEEE